MAARLSPVIECKRRGIGGQCQKSDFYEGDERLAEVLWTCENDLAPVIDSVVVERIDGQGRSPVTAVLRLVGRRIQRVNPWTH